VKATATGCVTALLYTGVALVLFAIALDPSNSEGTRIVSAIFLVGWGIGVRNVHEDRKLEAEAVRRQFDREQLEQRLASINLALHEIQRGVGRQDPL
jgi:hypothetical protein